MLNIFDLTGKVVIITGGYGYLGKSIVKGMAQSGAIIYVLGRSEDDFNKALSAKNGGIKFIKGDVSDSASIEQAYEEVNIKEGKIDVLVNNAFYSKGQHPEKMNDEDWNYGIDGSLNSVFRCIRAIIPYYKKNLGGKIINVASMYGMVSPTFEVYDEFPQYLNPPHYGAAKAGVIQMTKYYAGYLGKHGVNVNCISPGPFPNETVQEEKGFVSALSSQNSLGRIGKPEELVGAFVYLASDASSYVTGHNLVVDGGWTI